ncbi:peptidoglycan-binding protein [bacterium]|nr:peptidoglycan-binding protein [bacterium]
MSSFNPLQILRDQAQCPPTLREGQRGWHVKLLRRSLAASGLYSDQPGPSGRSKREELLDPDTPVGDRYDSALAGLVKKYQKRHGLDADGICGPKTWRRLAGWPERESWKSPGKDALAIADATARGQHHEMVMARQTVLRGEIVRLARQELALQVREKEKNRGPQVERYLRQAEGKPGWAWCAAYCEALLEWACQNLGMPVPFEIGLSCSALVKRAEAQGRIVAPGDEQPGDLWVLKRANRKKEESEYQHVGLIVKVRFEDCDTIEGNTNAAGSSEGDGVYSKARSLSRAKCAVVRVV